jgi:hypothetical protein
VVGGGELGRVSSSLLKNGKKNWLFAMDREESNTKRIHLPVLTQNPPAILFDACSYTRSSLALYRDAECDFYEHA